MRRKTRNKDRGGVEAKVMFLQPGEVEINCKYLLLAKCGRLGTVILLTENGGKL